MDEMEQLAYKNRFVRTLVQDLTDFEASIATPQIISGEDNIVLLKVSLQEWIQLLSSLFTGADICYPDTSDSVRWILLRAVEQPMSFCEMMINCINTTPSVMSAIETKLLASETFSDALALKLIENNQFNTYLTQKVSALTIEQITGPLTPGDCDNGVVAGRVMKIIDEMDTNNVDFLEIVEIGTNDEERMSNLIEAIPGVGELPADDIIEAAQSFLEDFAENYTAAVTTSWKSAVGRDLYCLALEQDDCILTYEIIFNYFQQRVGSGLTIESIISNVVQFLINGNFPTLDLVASGMYALQTAFILAGRDFNSLNLPKISGLMRDAAPSTIWQEWDACGTTPASIVWNFRISQQGWTGSGGPSYTVGVGWGNNGSGNIAISKVDVTTPINRIRVFTVPVGTTTVVVNVFKNGAFVGTTVSQGNGWSQLSGFSFTATDDITIVGTYPNWKLPEIRGYFDVP